MALNRSILSNSLRAQVFTVQNNGSMTTASRVRMFRHPHSMVGVNPVYNRRPHIEVDAKRSGFEVGEEAPLAHE